MRTPLFPVLILAASCGARRADRCLDVSPERHVVELGSTEVSLVRYTGDGAFDPDTLELTVEAPATAALVVEGDAVRLDVGCTEVGDGSIEVALPGGDPDCTELVAVACRSTGEDPKLEGPDGIAPGTHDCEVDGDGCLVAGDETCAITLDEELLAERATALLFATLYEAAGFSAISIKLYAELGYYEAFGPACNVTRDRHGVTRSITEGPAFHLASDDLGSATGPVDTVIECVVDNARGAISLTTAIAGRDDAPLQADGAEPSEDVEAIATLRNARLCGLEVTED